MRRTWGTGSLYQSGDRWIGRVEVRSSDGKRHARYVTGTDRDKVKARLRALLRSNPTASRGQTGTVGAFAQKWLASVGPTLAPRTAAGYEAIVRRHLAPLARLGLRELDTPAVQGWVNAQARRYSARSVSHQLAALRAMLNYAVRTGVVPVNVAGAAKPPTIRTAEVRSLSLEEARALIRETGEPLYILALSTGMRQGELLGLRWEDIDGPVIHVRRTMVRLHGAYLAGLPKTERSRRDIPLTGAATEALREQRRRQVEARLASGDRWVEQGLVFTRAHGSPLDASAVTRSLQAALERVALPRYRFHDLRHACASFLLAQGVPVKVVSDILGHSSATLTLNVYGHVLGDAKREATDRLGEVLG